jgi:hypothetical protein
MVLDPPFTWLHPGLYLRKSVVQEVGRVSISLHSKLNSPASLVVGFRVKGICTHPTFILALY